MQHLNPPLSVSLIANDPIPRLFLTVSTVCEQTGVFWVFYSLLIVKLPTVSSSTAQLAKISSASVIGVFGGISFVSSLINEPLTTLGFSGVIGGSVATGVALSQRKSTDTTYEIESELCA